jgi:hypothetical protein
MKRAFLALSAISILFFSGCGNLSPRLNPKINNQNGEIQELKNNQNGVIADLEALKNQQEIQNSNLDRIQQGLFNLQNIYENSGVQILSGPGGIIAAIIGMGCLTVVVLHYRSQAKTYEKTANILAEKIVSSGNADLEEEVFKAAMNTKAEEKVLQLIKKQKSLLG